MYHVCIMYMYMCAHMHTHTPTHARTYVHTYIRTYIVDIDSYAYTGRSDQKEVYQLGFYTFE